jgi:hypothetical protein
MAPVLQHGSVQNYGASSRTGTGEAGKVRTKISDAVKRQSEQLVVSFLDAAASNNRSNVEYILEGGSIEVDDADGACSGD